MARTPKCRYCNPASWLPLVMVTLSPHCCEKARRPVSVSGLMNRWVIIMGYKIVKGGLFGLLAEIYASY